MKQTLNFCVHLKETKSLVSLAFATRNTKAKQSQIVLYMIFGLVIFLIFLGTMNLAFQILPATKQVSTQDINQYTNNCLEQTLKCALYTQGLNTKKQALEETKTQSEQYTKKAMELCLGDLSKKFKGNNFKFTEIKPQILFGDEMTNIMITKLGELKNGNTQKTLQDYAAKTEIAFTKIHETAQKILQNNQKEKPIQLLNPRYKLTILQIDDTKEAGIITDTQSKINSNKEYKMVFAN